MFAVALVLAAVPAIPASAHPQGTKPVALIREVSPQNLEIVWVVALDDFQALLRAHGGIGPDDEYDAATLPPEDAAGRVRSYLLGGMAVENEGASCGEELIGAGRGGPGVAIVFRFPCPAPLARTQITISLLHDISTDYVTIAQARSDAGIARGLFTATAPALRLDFTAERPAARPVATGTATPTGRTGRILGALQGAPGSVSLAVALGLAFLLGALHALTPGHGKTMTAAYLVGAGGSMRQALTLGGIVSVTHAASVALLGGIAVALDRLLLPSDWIPWTEIVAGVLMLGVGLTLLRPREHGHEHGHEHGGPGELPWLRLAVLGLVGGLIPSPEAIGVLLVALSIGRWAAGMALVGALSVGLAAVVLAIAVIAVRGGTVARRLAHGRWSAVLPRAAAAVVLALGALVTVRGVLAL